MTPENKIVELDKTVGVTQNTLAVVLNTLERAVHKINRLKMNYGVCGAVILLTAIVAFILGYGWVW